MKRLFHSVLLAGLSLVAIACGGSGPKPATPEEAKLREEVKVGKQTPHSNCEELGVVTGSAGFGGWTKDENEIVWVQDKLRERAKALGGNFVVMDALVSKETSGRTTMSGRAYRCGDPQPAPATTTVDTHPAPNNQESPEERLRKLEDLRQKELITQEEYEERRKAIVEWL